MEIEVGNYKITPASETIPRFAALFWGIAGSFKTTLAATAPGKKLWILFDDGGLDSVKGLKAQLEDSHPTVATALKNEILVLDLSHERNSLISKFKSDDGLGLSKILSDDTIGIDTVVVDSVTRASQMGLELAISMGLTKGSKLETPGIPAFGARNSLMLRMIVDIMNVTGKYNKNIIFICHDQEHRTNDGDKDVIDKITMSLGGQLPNLTSQKLGEVWYVRDTGKQREIALRPFRVYKPMKTRMFDLATTTVEGAIFPWRYDINNPDPAFEIATWYKEWKDHGRKIAVPK